MSSRATHIARHAKVSGRIESAGDVQVDGRVEGGVRSSTQVVVSTSGIVIAEVHAASAQIDGVVIGNVIARDRITVSAGARVVGDLRAPVVEIAAGATIEGRVDRRIPDAEGLPTEALARTTVRLGPGGQPLRRPSRPNVPIVAPPEDDGPPLPAISTRDRTPPPPAPDSPTRKIPTPPRPAGRAKFVPRRKDEE